MKTLDKQKKNVLTLCGAARHRCFFGDVAEQTLRPNLSNGLIIIRVVRTVSG